MPFVAVQDPRRDRDGVALRHLLTRDLVVALGLADDQEGWREEPQRLVDDGAGELQGADRPGRARGREVEARRLAGDGVLQVGGARQHGEGPKDGECRRLVAGDDEGGELVPELVEAEALAGLGIDRRRHQLEEVVGAGARAEPLALLDHRLDEIQQAPAGEAPRDLRRARHVARQKDVARKRQAEVATVGLEQLSELRASTVHGGREHRPAGDLQGEALDHRHEVVGTQGLGLEAPDLDVEDLGRHPGDDAHGAGGEGGRERPTLVAPLLALAQEQPVADDGPEDAEGRGGAGVVLRVVDQHALDAGRVVGEDRALAEEGARQRHLLVGRPPPDGENVGAHRHEQLGPGHRRRGRRHARRLEALEAVGGDGVGHGSSPRLDRIGR